MELKKILAKYAKNKSGCKIPFSRNLTPKTAVFWDFLYDRNYAKNVSEASAITKEYAIVVLKMPELKTVSDITEIILKTDYAWRYFLATEELVIPELIKSLRDKRKVK